MQVKEKNDITLPHRQNPLFHSINEFSLGKELGEGAIAKVYTAIHKSSGKKYAIKKVIISTLSKGDFENVEKELDIHMELHNPYIIKMYDFFKENQVVYIVMDWAANGNLFQYLTSNSPMKVEEIGKFWTQTVLAIDYLHDKNIIMRDLKPENILLDENFNVKLCDFGWATRLSDKEYKKLQGGTYIYMSPECLKGEEQDKYSDVWSLGILLFELNHDREPFSIGDSCQEQLYFLKVQRVVFKKGFDRNISDIIYKLLKMEPEKRPTIKQILKDPYVLPFAQSCKNTTNNSSNNNNSNNNRNNNNSNNNSHVSSYSKNPSNNAVSMNVSVNYNNNKINYNKPVHNKVIQSQPVSQNMAMTYSNKPSNRIVNTQLTSQLISNTSNSYNKPTPVLRRNMTSNECADTNSNVPLTNIYNQKTIKTSDHNYIGNNRVSNTKIAGNMIKQDIRSEHKVMNNNSQKIYNIIPQSNSTVSRNSRKDYIKIII